MTRRNPNTRCMAGLYHFTTGGRGRTRASTAKAWSPGLPHRFQASIDAGGLQNKQRDEIRALLVEHRPPTSDAAQEALDEVQAKVDELFADRRTGPDRDARRLRQTGSCQCFSQWLHDRLQYDLSAEEIGRLNHEELRAETGQRRSRTGSIPKCATWNGRWCCRSSTPPGKTTCWPWTTCAARRSAGLRPGRSQGGVQARRHADVRADVDRHGRARHRPDLPHGAAGRGVRRRFDLGRDASARKEEAQAPATSPTSSRRPSGTQGDDKLEPIRNRGERVGRNDPCPCGSGKKYKQCCMRKTRRIADGGSQANLPRKGSRRDASA